MCSGTGPFNAAQDRLRALSSILARRRAGLINNDRGELRETGLDPIENPTGDVLAGRVGETFDFIEIIVVEPSNQRVGSFGNVAIINEITQSRIYVALNDHIESKRMPMQPAALMPVGKRRQIVRGFKVKLLN